MVTEAPEGLEYCCSQMAMPALAGGDGGDLVVDVVVVIGDAVLNGALVGGGVEQSNDVVGGWVVQPQG